MVKKRRHSRKRRVDKQKKWRILGVFLLGTVVLLAGYTAYLDIEIRRTFEGKRWAVPARVYARPLELFAGASLSLERFVEELKRLEYRSTNEPTRPGEYRRSGDRIRGFRGALSAA